jgi:hypothetical protein
VLLESDDNGSFTGATTRHTFAQNTAISSEWASVAGAVTDDYWRISWTVGGGSPDFTVVCAAGIIKTNGGV